jgi:uncharacterized membrane protein
MRIEEQLERHGLSRLLRRWFIAGLLVWIPLGVTLLVIRFIVNILNASLLLLPPVIRPEVPLLGVVLSVLIVIGTGAFAANYIGRRFLDWSETLVARIPVVRSVYGGMKKLAETVFSERSVAFRRPVLLEYPRKGIWSMGFQTGEPAGEVQRRTDKEVITVFVPTTPNPTSGFIVMVPREDVVWLDMSVEQAMRMIISLGVVTPDVPESQPAVKSGGTAPP